MHLADMDLAQYRMTSCRSLRRRHTTHCSAGRQTCRLSCSSIPRFTRMCQRHINCYSSKAAYDITILALTICTQYSIPCFHDIPASTFRFETRESTVPTTGQGSNPCPKYVHRICHRDRGNHDDIREPVLSFNCCHASRPCSLHGCSDSRVRNHIRDRP